MVFELVGEAATEPEFQVSACQPKHNEGIYSYARRSADVRYGHGKPNAPNAALVENLVDQKEDEGYEHRREEKYKNRVTDHVCVHHSVKSPPVNPRNLDIASQNTRYEHKPNDQRQKHFRMEKRNLVRPLIFLRQPAVRGA